METTKSRCSHSGYSLVEVTLALLVVAIGMTATFALFPEGLRATRAAVDDTEVSLFADYVFSTLSAAAAALGNKVEAGGGPNATKADLYASRVLAANKGYDNPDERLLDNAAGLHVFKWVPRNMDMGTGDWEAASKAKFWFSAFTYELEWEKKDKGNNRDTYYATLRVWPGEWDKIDDEDKFPPRIFYREITPYPDM
ncbi:MAG: prepilin-type N-terminal cleavage/methylation domain-containing protein [Spartobacteria bacterium]|nr:prepilin-type N-terminal cleavage/methylation domain-containing protein [Spartobacteria bacterium]